MKKRHNDAYWTANSSYTPQSYYPKKQKQNPYSKDSYYNKFNFPYYQEYPENPIKKSKRKLNHYYDKITSTHLQIPEHTINLINDLISNSSECMICHEIIYEQNPIWSCSTCWTLFHLNCINQWIKQKNIRANENEFISWTCPLCNSTYEYKDYPTYNCYCGKYFTAEENNNRHFDPYLIPHGCGLYCNAPVCIHVPQCHLPCHPGPHVQCKEKIIIKCYCGNSQKELNCSINNEESFSCGEICSKEIGCKKNHLCKAICHYGSCVQFLKNGKCYECIAESRDRLFSFLKRVELKLKSECFEARNLTHFASILTQFIFNGILPCGEHHIEIKVDANLKLLLRLLEISGNNLLENLKTFIPICEDKVTNSCYCKSKSLLTKCFILNYPEDILDLLGIVKERELEKCNKVCNTYKNCRNHKCERVCCELKDVHISNYSLQDPLGYHLCMIICNKPLNCGKHKCENYCHRGACKPCAYIIHEGEIYCKCKKTKISTPYICGSKVVCNYPCSAIRKCEHPCSKKCHEGPCPQCEYLTFKKCRCGKNIITDIKCGDNKEILCDYKCGNMLNCGVHFCDFICHDHTEEYDKKYKCDLLCNRQLLYCNHLCKMKCHGETDCDEYICEGNAFAYCKCKTIVKGFICKELKKMNEKDEKGIYMLECGEECLKKERLRKIEETFDGLNTVNENKVKLIYPNYTPQLSEDPIKEIPEKYDWDTITKSNANIQEVIRIEKMLYEKVLKGENEEEEEKKEKEEKENAEKMENINELGKEEEKNKNEILTNKKKEILIQIESNLYDQICEWLIIYHNLKPKKIIKTNKKTKEKKTYISLSEESLKNFHYQPYRLSLIALLLNHNLFVSNRRIKVFHPFKYTIFIKNYKSKIKYDELETAIITFGNAEKKDFYLDEFKKKEFYCHFFNEIIGKKVYNIVKTRPIEFQEVFEINYEVKEVKESELYSYYEDEKYFKYLYDGCSGEYTKLCLKKKEEILDGEGFIKVKNKKKHHYK